MTGTGDQNVGRFSSSLGQEDAHIYLLATLNTEKLAYGWFVIKNDLCSDKVLKHVFLQNRKNKVQSTCVALGSTIYVLGGKDSSLLEEQSNQFSKEVEYIDILHPEQGWKMGPPLLAPRVKAYATIIDDKICVMGSRRTSDVVPWAEVFDPLLKDKNNGWQPFYHSSGCPPSIYGHAILDGGKEILVHSPFKNSLHSLNIEKGSFDLYSSSFGCFFGPNIFMDGIMYCCEYMDPFIYGYDVTQRKISLEKVFGLENVPQRAPVALLCVGKGKLCAIWDSRDHRTLRLRLTCLKFFVSKERHESGRLRLTASSVERSEYMLDACWLFDCVAVFPYQGEIEKSFAALSIAPTPTVLEATMKRLQPTSIKKKSRNKNKKKKE